MEFEDVVKGRRSIRGYKPDAVPQKVIEEVIELATRSPSSMNTQPWHFYVVTGEPLEKIRKGNTELNLAGVTPSREIRSHGAYEGEHRRRQIDIAIQLFQAMGIERDDAEKRQDWILRGFRQFDAPLCIVVTFDKELQDGDIAQFDCGAAVNGLVQAAWSKGLGAVVNSQGIMQSPVVREHAGIPDDQVIMICVAMGYPDEEFPANSVVSRRRPVSEVASFVGFYN
ncbi:MAG: nitroreductase [Pseudomonadales bacterium]